MRSVATRSPPSSSSASSPFSVSSVKSPRTSSQISASSHLPLVLSRSPLRHTLSACSKIPTSAPSTPSGKHYFSSLSTSTTTFTKVCSVSPSNPRTSSSLVVSVANVLRCLLLNQIDLSSNNPSRHTRSNMTITSVDKHGGKAFVL